MKQIIIIVFCAFILISCQSKKQGIDIASCIVSDSQAIAKIPIIPQKSYKFYKNSTPENVMEYACGISLNEYGFGFTLFKGPGYKERKGDLERLIAGGQSDIWKSDGYHSRLVEGHGVITTFFQPYIVLKIDNKETIELLFNKRPATCSFSIIGFEADKHDGTITIEYKKS